MLSLGYHSNEVHSRCGHVLLLQECLASGQQVIRFVEDFSTNRTGETKTIPSNELKQLFIVVLSFLVLFCLVLTRHFLVLFPATKVVVMIVGPCFMNIIQVRSSFQFILLARFHSFSIHSLPMIHLSRAFHFTHFLLS